MYKKFFGLKENPFNVTPDPRYLYSTPHTQEALACLTYCVQGRKGFVLLTGDVGTGKTTLLNKLLECLRQEQVATAFVFNPRLNTLQFLDYVVSDFGINCETRLKSQVLVQLNQWLLERYRAGGTAVLIVDEAQNLSAEVLEEIRLLTNLETSTEKLLQIVLSGQQELEMRLRQPEFRQLRQRITLRCKTYPLTLEETRNYVATRLRVAGSAGRQIFTPAAIEAAHNYSEGIPRVINVICEDALISAFADQKPAVDRGMVEAVARELELDIYPPTAPPPGQIVERTRVNEYSGAAYGLGAALETEDRPATDTPRKTTAEPPQRRQPSKEDSKQRKDVTNTGTSPPSPTVSLPVSQDVPAKGPAVSVAVEPHRGQASAAGPATRPAVAPSTISPAVNARPVASKTARVAGETGPTGTTSTTPVAVLPVPPAVAERQASDAEIVQLLRPDASAAKPPAARPTVRQPLPLPKVKSGRMTPMAWALLGLCIAVSLVAAFMFVELSRIRNTPPMAVSSPAASQTSAPSKAAEIPIPSESTQTPAAPQPATVPATEEKKSLEVAPQPKTATPPVRRSIPTAPSVGRLLVTADVAGARVSLDGRAIANAETPFTFTDLPVGTHRIVVSKPGHEDATASVTVQGGRTVSFSAHLAAPGGEINIVTNPSGLGVSIDGGPFAPSPTQAVVAAGSHTYRIKLPGSRVYESTFEMKNGAIITRRVDFTGGEWLTLGETQ
jgi:type II secretory pathway predicted ATPase ExeA